MRIGKRSCRDFVVEAMLLEKYKELLFCDPDININFTVHGTTLSFTVVREVDGTLLATFLMRVWKMSGLVIGEMIIGMISETEQAKGVELVLAEETEEDEEVPRDIWATGKPEAEDEDGNTSC